MLFVPFQGRASPVTEPMTQTAQTSIILVFIVCRVSEDALRVRTSISSAEKLQIHVLVLLCLIRLPDLLELF